MARIGFIGLGNMGLPMAQNLIKAGHQVEGVDVNGEAVKKLVAAGGASAGTHKIAAARADVVITMLPAGQHVRDVYLGPGGIIENANEGTLLIDCSTIDVESARVVAAAAQERGLMMLDAPVSGGVGGAIAGTLTFMVGGDADVLEQAKPVFSAMGRNIFHAGTDGAGQVAKVCNNQLLAVLMIGTAESLALGVANGLDPRVLSEIMRRSSGGNWALEVYNPWPGVMENAPATRGYEGGFLTSLMVKDLGLAQEAALVSGNSTPMGSLATSLYRLLLRQGFGDKDFSVVQKLFDH